MIRTWGVYRALPVLVLTAACLWPFSTPASVRVADDFESRRIYEKKATWQETILAARAKLILLLRAEDRALRGVVLGDWFEAGPVKIRRFTDVVYPGPETELVARDGHGSVRWRKRTNLKDGRIHLLEKARHCTYLRRVITAEKAMSVDAYLGATDGAKVWLNGDAVFSKEYLGYRRKHFENISLPLKRGENELVLAVYNYKDECGFHFSVNRDYAFRIWEQVEKDFPVQWDWAGQDGGDGLRAWLGNDDSVEIEKMMIGRVLKELGPEGLRYKKELDRLTRSNVHPSSRRWFDIYVEACEKRRAKRLKTLLDKSPNIVFTKHQNIGGTHYSYTEAQSDAQRERYFHPGASLCRLDMDGLYGKERTLLDDPRGFIRDPDVSLDAQRLLFSWKKSDREDDFHLYEMDLDNDDIRQLTHGLGFADYEGAYLPNGDIVFNSTRCVQTVDCWWTEVSNLYTCAKDGQYLRRLSFDQVHTNYPSVMPDGRVIYTRWDYNDRGQGRVHPLFQMNPDGTGQTEFLIAYEPVGWTRAWYGDRILFSSNIYFQSVKSGAIFRDPPLLRYKIYWMDLDGRRELLAADPEISCNQPVPVASREVPVKPSMVDYRQATGTFYLKDIYTGPGLAGIPRGTIKKLRVVGLEFRAAGIGGNSNRGPAAGAIVSTPISIGNGSWDVKVVHGEAQVYEDGSAQFTVPARTPVYFQALDEKGYAVQTMRSWSTLQPGETFACIGCHEYKNEAPGHYGKSSLAQEAGPQTLDPFYGPARGFSFQKEIQPILDRHCIQCHDDRSNVLPLVAKANHEPIPAVPEKQREDPDRAFSLLGTLNPEYKPGRKWSDAYLSLTNAYNNRGNHPSLRGRWDHDLVNWISPQSIPPMLPPYHKGAARSGLMTLLETGHKGVKLSREDLEKIACWIDLLVPYCGDYTEANTWGDEGMARYTNWFKDDLYAETDPTKRYQHFLDKRRRMEAIEAANIAALIEKQ